jgi:rubredoxin-NAD+ reductase
MEPVVVIGAGLAGVTVARELRRQRPHLPIVLVTSDDGHVYPKPQLTASLRLRREPDALIRTRAEELRAEGLTLLTRHFVTRLDPLAQAIELENGDRLAYRALVLAVGATPVRPTIAGDAGHEVLTVNHLDDYRRFRERLRADLPVLLVGGGLIGTEFAADLAASGHRVHVVDPGPGPLPRLLPEAAGRALTQALASAGVTHHWGCTLDSLERAPEEGYLAALDDGTRLSVGTVLAAVGLRPNTGLAREAGLPVQRGIRVDAHLRVGPTIFALGDCAELPGGLLLPFIKPITAQARHIARAIAGEEEAPFTLENVSVTVKVPQWPVMSSTPHPSERGSWFEEVSPTGTFSRLRDDEGRLWRIVATGDRVQDPVVAAAWSELPALV